MKNRFLDPDTQISTDVCILNNTANGTSYILLQSYFITLYSIKTVIKNAKYALVKYN